MITDELGTAEVHDGGARLRFERRLRHPIDRVWAALTRPEELEGWLASAEVGLVVAVVAEAQAAGTWRRLKACPGKHCGWVFYDHSRSATSTWCSMAVCGGREKARAYRRRSRRPSS